MQNKVTDIILFWTHLVDLHLEDTEKKGKGKTPVWAAMVIKGITTLKGVC